MDGYYAKWRHPVNTYYCGRAPIPSPAIRGLNHCCSNIYNKKYIDIYNKSSL